MNKTLEIRTDISGICNLIATFSFCAFYTQLTLCRSSEDVTLNGLLVAELTPLALAAKEYNQTG